MNDKYQAILLRFAKGFIASFVSTGATLYTTLAINIHSFPELAQVLYAVALAGIVAGISGLFMAVEKYLNWTDAPTV